MLNRLTRVRLTKADSEKLVEQIKDHVVRHAAPEEIFLFGSAARGELTDGSDLDIAVIFSTENEIISAKKAVYANRLPIVWPVDYLFYSREEFEKRRRSGGVCEIIGAEGKSIYKKGQTT